MFVTFPSVTQLINLRNKFKRHIFQFRYTIYMFFDIKVVHIFIETPSCDFPTLEALVIYNNIIMGQNYFDWYFILITFAHCCKSLNHVWFYVSRLTIKLTQHKVSIYVAHIKCGIFRLHIPCDSDFSTSFHMNVNLQYKKVLWTRGSLTVKTHTSVYKPELLMRFKWLWFK